MTQNESTNNAIPQRPKQMFILLNILALTMCTAISNGLYRVEANFYFRYPVTAPVVLLVLVFTNKLGRKILFITLYILYLLSSIVYLFEWRDICGILHSPVQGASIALLPIAICEYCDPKQRLLYLVANSAIQFLFYWVTLVLSLSSLRYVIGNYLQYLNILIGIVGLWSVYQWPESPYWLVSKGRFEECSRAFVEVRGGNSESSEELQTMISGRPRRGYIKMFYVPILLAVPVLYMYVPTDDSLQSFDTITSNLIGPEKATTWLFLTLKCIAAVACVASVFFPGKLLRKILFFWCALIYLFYAYAEHVMLEEPDPSTIIMIFVLILDTLVDYGPRIATMPFLIELVPQKYVTTIAAVISEIYIVMEWGAGITDAPKLVANTLFFIVVLVCYYVMPEARNVHLLEIEEFLQPIRWYSPPCP